MRRVVLGTCAIALAILGCGYRFAPQKAVIRDVGFNMSPTGCAGNVGNVGNTCFLRDLDAVKRTGGRSVRIDISWSWIERNAPGPKDRPQTDCITRNLTLNCWYWHAFDQRVRGAEARGMKVLLVPTYAPSWAALAGCRTSRCGPDPSRVWDFAHFVDESVKRYGPGGVAGTHVTSWEIWNEPNGYGFGPKADPIEYTQMLKAAYVVIKSYPKQAHADIVTGGTAPGTNDKRAKTTFKPLTWLRCLYDNSICKSKVHGSAKGFFTAVGHHPYSGIAAPLADFNWNSFRQTQALYRVMQANGDGAKKIWATEFGYSSDKNRTFGVGLARQADYLVEAVVDWHKWSYGGPMFVYDIRDAYNPAQTDSSQPDAEHNKFTTAGMLNYNYSNKPAALALYALTHG